MTAWRTYSRLSGSERRLLEASVLLVAAVRLLLWLLPSRLTLSVARSLVMVPERPSTARPSLERIIWAIDAASRRIPQATCLTQAIAAQLLLRRYGYGARLCLGVAADGHGGFRAHAWVERDGTILIGGEESRGLSRLTLPPREPSTVQVP